MLAKKTISNLEYAMLITRIYRSPIFAIFVSHGIAAVPWPSHATRVVLRAKCKWCGNHTHLAETSTALLGCRAHSTFSWTHSISESDVWLSPPVTVPVKMRTRCSTVKSWQGCRAVAPLHWQQVFFFFLFYQALEVKRLVQRVKRRSHPSWNRATV